MKRKKKILKLSKKKQHCYLSPKYIRKLQNYTEAMAKKKWNRNDTRIQRVSRRSTQKYKKKRAVTYSNNNSANGINRFGAVNSPEYQNSIWWMANVSTKKKALKEEEKKSVRDGNDVEIMKSKGDWFVEIRSIAIYYTKHTLENRSRLAYFWMF